MRERNESKRRIVHFRRRDVERAMKSARAEGLEIGAVEVTTRDGTIIKVFGKDAKPETQIPGIRFSMLRTKSGLPRHCSWNEDRHGTRRVRFRRAGFSAYLSGTPWGEDFMRQYAAALEGVKTQNSNIGAERTIPGSINSLIVSYYRSPEYRGLKASTQTVRKRIIESFRLDHGDKRPTR